jgi:phosphoserine aminotransferase
MKRKKNYFAGPAVMPLEVLQQLEDELIDFEGHGLSILEASHRDEPFEGMYFECLDLVRSILQIPDNYEVFFLGGGATLQFSMIPLNFLAPNSTADYPNTGTWSNKAAKDAAKIGSVNTYYDGKATHFSALPVPSEVKPSPGSSYLYLCSNETTGGIQWQEFPQTGDVPLIADISSDLLSRPLPISQFSLLIGGVQKNVGPAGATLIILKKELLERQNKGLPSYLDYSIHAKENGLYNTPPSFSIWAVKLALQWIKKNGGVEGMAQRANHKASLLYDVIDQSGGFYRNHIEKPYRSNMNVVFRLPSEELENKFLQEAQKADMLGLKGHRSVGGMRASIYNALPTEDVEALALLMRDFQEKNG